MEGLSGDQLPIRVVKVVADEGIAKMLHVNTDLMGAASLQSQGEKAAPIFFFQDAIVGDGRLAVFKIDASLDDGAGSAP